MGRVRQCILVLRGLRQSNQSVLRGTQAGQLKSRLGGFHLALFAEYDAVAELFGELYNDVSSVRVGDVRPEDMSARFDAIVMLHGGGVWGTLGVLDPKFE